MRLRASLVALLVLGWCQVASADLIIGTDMDLSVEDGNIEVQREVMLGEVFDVGIVFKLTEPSSIFGYSFSVRYNSDVLEFVNRAESFPPGFGKMIVGDRPDVEFGTDDPTLGPGNYGQLMAFEAGTLGDPIAAPWSFQVATLTFRAKALTTGDSLTVLPGSFDPLGGDAFVNGEFEVQPFLSEGGAVTVVPEPSSLVLLGSVLSALVGLMIYRKRSGR